jgi:hypothetical protein
MEVFLKSAVSDTFSTRSLLVIDDILKLETKLMSDLPKTATVIHSAWVLLKQISRIFFYTPATRERTLAIEVHFSNVKLCPILTSIRNRGSDQKSVTEKRTLVRNALIQLIADVHAQYIEYCVMNDAKPVVDFDSITHTLKSFDVTVEIVAL